MHLSVLSSLTHLASMLQPSQFYHIYNQGNNRQRIFFEVSNYDYFLTKVQAFVLPYTSVLAYCLMPNHFHFLVYTNDSSCFTKHVGSLNLQALTNGFRTLESVYAHAINKKFGWSGSLFRQRTKVKLIPDSANALTCMNYIHQNPLKAGLVIKLEQWRYSSFREICGFGKQVLCNKAHVDEHLQINPKTFYADSYLQISPEVIRACF
jgi:putative transposase